MERTGHHSAVAERPKPEIRRLHPRHTALIRRAEACASEVECTEQQAPARASKKTEKQKEELVRIVSRSKTKYYQLAQKAAEHQNELLSSTKTATTREKARVHSALKEMKQAAEEHVTNIEALTNFLQQYNEMGPKVLDSMEGINEAIVKSVKSTLTGWLDVSEQLCKGVLRDIMEMKSAMDMVDAGADFEKFVVNNYQNPVPDPEQVYKFRMYDVGSPPPSPRGQPELQKESSFSLSFNSIVRPIEKIFLNSNQQSGSLTSNPEDMESFESLKTSRTSTHEVFMCSEELQVVFQNFVQSLEFDGKPPYAGGEVHFEQGFPGLCRAVIEGVECEKAAPNSLLCALHLCRGCGGPKPSGYAHCSNCPIVVTSDSSPYALSPPCVDQLQFHEGRMMLARLLKDQSSTETRVDRPSFEALNQAVSLALDEAERNQDVHAAACLILGAMHYHYVEPHPAGETKESGGDGGEVPSEQGSGLSHRVVLGQFLKDHPFCMEVAHWEEWFSVYLKADSTDFFDSITSSKWQRTVNTTRSSPLAQDLVVVKEKLETFFSLLTSIGVDLRVMATVRNRLADCYGLSDEERLKVWIDTRRLSSC
eukprot:NODE_608_length_2028_cov_24.687533_g565_i0.p1 GENE.NODE_608_length_2028_cov_24.687533_g565_i0~~NODE_608_length_2028_cov_24.687533_g565_i0.p1  ORF type:complete len:593 (+),score=130.35 NODE_608_length_2028_cov_24.687533_g565_i0:220-1998(+)